jgi:hypothetical protein
VDPGLRLRRDDGLERASDWASGAFKHCGVIRIGWTSADRRF